MVWQTKRWIVHNLDGQRYEIEWNIDTGVTVDDNVASLSGATPVTFTLGPYTCLVGDGGMLPCCGLDKRLYINSIDVESGESYSNHTKTILGGALVAVCCYLFGILVLLPLLIWYISACIYAKNRVVEVVDLPPIPPPVTTVVTTTTYGATAPPAPYNPYDEKNAPSPSTSNEHAPLVGAGAAPSYVDVERGHEHAPQYNATPYTGGAPGASSIHPAPHAAYPQQAELQKE